MSNELIISTKSNLEKIKSELKPPEHRIEAWRKVLGGMFEFEVNALQEVIDLTPDSIPEIPTKLDENQINLYISTIKPTEDLITSLKRDEKRLQDERKTFTSKMDTVKDRLSVPEKTVKVYYEALQSHLIKLKKIEQKRSEEIASKQRETTQFKAQRQFAYNDEVTAFKKHIIEKVSDIYKYALDNISVLEIDEYKEKNQWLYNEHNTRQPNHQFENKEHQKINDEIFSKWKDEKFEDFFLKEFSSKFSDFETAVEHKNEALKKNEELNSAAVLDLDEEKKIEDVSVKLEASVSPLKVVLSGTKSLQVKYQIDMPDTDESMVSIIRAFFGNLVACMATIRRQSKFDISVRDMGNALCAIKNKGRFEPEGITFKEIDSL